MIRSPWKAFLGVALLGLLNACTGSNHAVSLQSIGVTGATSAAAGSATQLTATGMFSDGSHADITYLVTWTSGNKAIATVSTAGMVTGVAAGSTTVSAAVQGVTGSATYIVTGAVLASIEVTPPILSIASGRTVLMTATGVYSDNSTLNLGQVTWRSSNSAVASVSSSGVATAVGVGSATIFAISGGISGSTTLNVTGAVLTTIQVTPATPSVAKGLTQQFSATGIFSDNSKQDLTSQVSWSSSSTAVATIAEPGGLATGAAVGSATISATIGSVTGNTTFTVTAALLTTIQVTPATPTIAKGLAKQFIATGIFTDNSTLDLTFQVTWNSSNTAAATASNAAATAGTVTAVAPGMATIAANLGSISGGTLVTVTPATLASIHVTPPAPFVALGVTQQFTATGIYTDSTTQNLTTQVTWSSSATAAATISNAAGTQGLATPAAVGPTTITAASGAISGSTLLSVTPAQLVSIQVTPAIPSVAKGLTKQFTATGIYTDNSTQNLTSLATWASDNLAVATISNAAGSSGLASTPGTGSATISATFNVVTGSTTLTVAPAQLVSLAVTPASPSIPKGLTQQFVATGTYTDQSTQNLTASASILWSSDTTSVATISNAAGSQGLASTPATGTATISATFGTSGISGSTLLTVTAAVIQSISVTPPTPSVASGLTQQFTATGIYTDSTTQDLTVAATWTSTDTTIATISNVALSNGLASSSTVKTGQTTIRAAYTPPGGSLLTGSTTLTVTAAALKSIAVTPANPSVAAGRTQQFTATGTYTDNSTQNLTSQVTWASDNLAAATISNASGSYGLATSLTVGTPTISATQGSISGSTTLTVTAPVLTSIAVTQSSVTNPNIALGSTAQYAAIGTYSDHSSATLTSVSWTSSNTGAATIDLNTGLATSVAYGATTITATDTGGSGVFGGTNTKVIASFQYGSSVFGILSANCASSSCHSATGSIGPPNTVVPSGDYWTLYDTNTSVTPAAATQASILSGTFNSGISGASPNLVVPGNPSGSTFYIATCLPIPGGSFIIRMPVGTSGLNAAQCAIINEWINEGASLD
ncbi:MAG TPA: Ig-like domain-containing protein [Steroidobacteraceae bacterium]|nr:Ig-like domain-containing protein [Steroidobacteraceae bacterium]